MLEINPVAVPKAADVLAGNLREQILDGRLAPGVTLPNERELAARAGLSRPSVREALRILEAEGLIATRVGRTGGAEVLRPDASGIRRSVGIFMRGQNIRIEAVLEAREAIEPQAARLAAMHHTDVDWTELAEAHERLHAGLDDIPKFLKANLDWHLAVMRASHNELLIAFISAIAQPVYAATDLRGFNSTEVRHAVWEAHGKVMNAIRARDGGAAFRRMGRHVGAYVEGVARRNREEQAQAQVTESNAQAGATAA